MFGTDCSGAQDGAADEMGEAHLAPAAAGQVVVDDDPVVHQQLCRDGAYAGRGRDGQALLHIADHAGGRALQDGRLDWHRPRRRRRGGQRVGEGGWLGRPGDIAGLQDARRGRRLADCGGGVLGGCVPLEELPPGRVDAGGIPQELLVDLVDDPLIRSEGSQPGLVSRHR